MAEQCRIPQVSIAPGRQAPVLVLGDNGFLRKYGSTMTAAEIAETIGYALSRASVGIGAGDRRVLRAARRAKAPWILHHTDVRFLAGQRRSHFGRCMATLHTLLLRQAPAFAATDPLMGSFVASYERFKPYTGDAAFAADDQSTEGIVTTIREYRPEVTTIGGDYLDALLAVGAFDAARLALKPIVEECRRSDSVPVLTTYLAGLLSDGMLEIAADFQAVMVPFNATGVAMAPDRSTVVSSLRRLGLPVIAMHVLAAGTVTPEEALRHAMSDGLVSSAIVGASSRPHIDRLITAATS